MNEPHAFPTTTPLQSLRRRATRLAPLVLMTLALACKEHTETPKSAAKGAAPTPTATATATPDTRNWQPVTRGDVEYLVPTVGSFRARQVSKLASQVGGRVEHVLVDVGEHVNQGQELLRIDSALFKIEVAQRQAEVEAARVALTDADLTLSRLKGLWNEGESSAIPRQMLDEAQARRDGAEARVKQAEQALSYSRQRLEDTVVRAPYSGMITARMVDNGESVTTTPVTPLLEIQETEVLELLLSLPQDSMALVRPGTPLRFEADGLPGMTFESTVETVYPTIDEATRSFLSRAWVQNPELKLRPGMLAQVNVFAGRVENVLTVPRKSLSKSGSSWTVMVNREGVPVLQEVQVGLVSIENAEIRGGLNEGDQVLILNDNR